MRPSDDARTRRDEHARAQDGAARAAAPPPAGASAASVLGYYPSVPQDGRADCLAAVAAYAPGNFPAGPIPGCVLLGAPGPRMNFVTGIVPVPSHKCRKVQGRWVAQNHHCRCGPVHPQKTVTLAVTFPAARVTLGPYNVPTSWLAIDPIAASVPMTWGAECPEDDRSAGSGKLTAYGWQADHFADYLARDPATGAYGGPFWTLATVSGSLVATGYNGFFGTDLGNDGGAYADLNTTGRITPQYARHRFTLRCRASGFDLLHEMRPILADSPPHTSALQVFGPGYRATYRGIVRTGVPFRCEFLDGPVDWEAIDVSYDGSAWRTTYSGQRRAPRANGVAVHDSVVLGTRLYSIGLTGSLGDSPPPFGGWSFTATA